MSWTSYTKGSDKMAYTYSADQDQTAPEGAVWSGSTLFAISLYILTNNCIKRKIKARKVWNKVFGILGPLPYFIKIEDPCPHSLQYGFFIFVTKGL